MSDDLHLIAIIAGQRVALPTVAIDSVVEIDAISPVPRAPAHIAGLAALRSRVLTVVDCEAALGLDPAAPPAGPRTAVVLACDGHLYGLLVERVEDVAIIAVRPEPLRSGFASGWARVAGGVATHDGAALLMVDPMAFLVGQQAVCVN